MQEHALSIGDKVAIVEQIENDDTPNGTTGIVVAVNMTGGRTTGRIGEDVFEIELDINQADRSYYTDGSNLALTE